MIHLKTENIEDEIEEFLKSGGLMSDEGIVYEGWNVHSLSISGKEELKTVVHNYAVLFHDEKYIYVAMNDANLLALEGRVLSNEQRKFATDFSIDKLKKNQYAFLADE